MKKLILILTIALLPFMVNAQTLSQFEDTDGVTTVIVNKKAFELMSTVGTENEEAKEFVELLQGINELKVFTTENSEVVNKMKNAIQLRVKKDKLSELLRVNDKDAKVNIYIKEGNDKDHVTELLMFVNELKNNGGNRSPEAVILLITGDIDLTRVSQLINQMNVSDKNLKLKK
tara:strand:- start:297 stop:818 length:522 start_codon:yes stop_codon:yes gene_type:complete